MGVSTYQKNLFKKIENAIVSSWIVAQPIHQEKSENKVDVLSASNQNPYTACFRNTVVSSGSNAVYI